MVAFFCLGCLYAGNCFSQTASAYIDSSKTHVELYGIKQQIPAMFVHFDKTVYSNNENVWFTAYLINPKRENDHTVLLVNLVKDDSRKVVLEDKFLIQKGLAFGNMFIPDSISAGNYTLVAYTNVMKQGRPWVIFKQSITIKTSGQQTFNAYLSPIDTAITSAERKVRLLANISIQPLANAQVSYYVGSPASHVLSGVVKTSVIGEYIFNIPSKILSEGNNKLYVNIQYNKEEKEVSMVLPVAKQPDVVNFYPEGGNLVNNLQTHVGWETKAANGSPIKATAVLYQNDKPVDTIETNGYGMGKFLITPRAGTRYYVKLFNAEKQYELPVVLSVGPSLTTQHALANDTLSVMLFDNKPEKLLLLVHNYKQLFAAMPILMTGANKRVKVLLVDVPKGITQLTITDSLGRPFLQRTFFAHYNRRETLQINTGLPEYTTRQKVNVKIRLNKPAADTSAMALVSIACVQDNRVEAKKKSDIESYFYLKNELGELPLKDNYLGNEEADKGFLEDVLLIKGWSRYKWTDVLKVKEADTVRQFTTPVFSGLVSTVNNKPLKKPVQVMLMNGAGVTQVETDSTGNIIFDNNDLVTEPEKKLLAMVGGDNPDSYKVQIVDPYSLIDPKILDWLTYKDYNTTAQQNTANAQLDGFQRSIKLNEVKIIDKKDDQFFGVGKLYVNAKCGDYICRYGILNCPNHRNERDNVYITDCPIKLPPNTSYRVMFKGIYNSVEFYPADYSQLNPSQPDYVSTIYWNHLSQIKSTGDAEFSFYTSDITGRFKIIVQGITSNDVVYGEKTFNVVKAK